MRRRHLQKSTEDDISNPLYSSVLFCRVPAHTLPAQERQRDKCLFELARWVKEHWPDATRDELRVIVHEWHERALPVIGTKDFGTSWADFLTGWEKVRQPYGATETFEQTKRLIGWRSWLLCFDCVGSLHRLEVLKVRQAPSASPVWGC